MSTVVACPCGQGNYVSCCQRLHLKQSIAESAEALMRSRYSAFALGCIDYLVASTAIGQQQRLDRAALLAWSQQNQWLELDIIGHQAKVDKTHAAVEFKAHYAHEGEKAVHHELSYFVYMQQQWYFLDPTLEHFPTLKQPCVCGSGKKFKLCCAQFLSL